MEENGTQGSLIKQQISQVDVLSTMILARHKEKTIIFETSNESYMALFQLLQVLNQFQIYWMGGSKNCPSRLPSQEVCTSRTTYRQRKEKHTSGEEIKIISSSQGQGVKQDKN